MEQVNKMHEFSSAVSYSPSFSYYASDEFSKAAVKVSREIQSYNTTDHQQYSDNDEIPDFEFETSPFHEKETFVHFPTFKNDNVTVSKKKDNDVAASTGWKSKSTTTSPSWSELEEFEDFSSNCLLWSPLCSPLTSKTGTETSDLSSRISKRRRLKNFLTRSQSDGAVSCSFKGFMKRSHSDGSKTTTSSPVVKGKDKTASSRKSPMIGEGGDKRRKSYLPYRQDLIGVFTVMRKLRH